MTAPITPDPRAASTAEIETLADAFLAGVPGYVWDGASLPVPVEEIADSHLGLLVRDVEDLRTAPGAPARVDGQGLSGLLLPHRGEIWVNADEARRWPARRRFTIAHELGHWRMHRGAGDAVFCRSTVIDPSGPGAPIASKTRLPPPPAEEEANAFAAALLMPARLVRERYACEPRDFAGLCAAFGASGAAMGRRLHAVIPRAPS